MRRAEELVPEAVRVGKVAARYAKILVLSVTCYVYMKVGSTVACMKVLAAQV